MEPLLIIIVPGVLGGIVLALLMSRLPAPQNRERQSQLEPPSTSMINMARIRIVGVGGLGMVAMAITVAIFVPRIRSSMILAFVLGVVLAMALIAVRRRKGPLSSSDGPGAHVMFPMEPPPAPGDSDRSSTYSRHELAAEQPL